MKARIEKGHLVVEDGIGGSVTLGQYEAIALVQSARRLINQLALSAQAEGRTLAVPSSQIRQVLAKPDALHLHLCLVLFDDLGIDQSLNIPLDVAKTLYSDIGRIIQEIEVSEDNRSVQ